MLRLEPIEHRPLRDRARDLEGYLSLDPREGAQMLGQNDTDH
jgi:hypothetical protein